MRLHAVARLLVELDHLLRLEAGIAFLLSLELRDHLFLHLRALLVALDLGGVARLDLLDKLFAPFRREREVRSVGGSELFAIGGEVGDVRAPHHPQRAIGAGVHGPRREVERHGALLTAIGRKPHEPVADGGGIVGVDDGAVGIGLAGDGGEPPFPERAEAEDLAIGGIDRDRPGLAVRGGGAELIERLPLLLLLLLILLKRVVGSTERLDHRHARRPDGLGLAAREAEPGQDHCHHKGDRRRAAVHGSDSFGADRTPAADQQSTAPPPAGESVIGRGFPGRRGPVTRSHAPRAATGRRFVCPARRRGRRWQQAEPCGDRQASRPRGHGR